MTCANRAARRPARQLLVWALVGAATAVLSCESRLVSSADSSHSIADLEVLWQAVDTHYPYLEFKGIDWDALYTTYKPRAEAARGDEFYRVLHDLLGHLQDGHVYYKTPGGGREIYPWVPPRRLRDQQRYDPFVVRRYFDGPLHLSDSGAVEYGILPDGIGYAFLADFHEDFLVRDFPHAMAFLRDTPGLILDIRQRRGGSPPNVVAVVSQFLTGPLRYPPAYLYGAEVDWPLAQPAPGAAYTAPVVVLINGLTYSAGEFCAEMLKQLPNVTAMGDTTGGGSAGGTSFAGYSSPFRLPSGKWFDIGNLDIRRYDGLPWEGLGIPPDILVPQPESDLRAGQDRQLQAAIDLLQ